MPTNDIARFYAQRNASSKQELDLVEFLDGNVLAEIAVQSSPSHFLESWKRHPWRPSFPANPVELPALECQIP